MDLMTTAQLLGNFGEFIGAIAVVVTLVYLAVQLRQNTSMIRANIRQARSDASVAQYSLAATSQIADLRVKERNGHQLSEVEEERLFLWQVALWRGQQTIFFQNREGLLDDQTQDEQGFIVRGLMTTPSAQRFWARSAQSLDSRFVEWVDEQLASR